MDKPRLYLFIGPPGAGKTTIAQLIAEQTGAIHLWADHERRKLFGDPTHSVAESNKLYDHLNSLTDELLSKSNSVIFDTNFNFYNDRQRLRRIASRYDAETILIWVTTPTGKARRRAVGDRAKIRNGYFAAMTDKQFDAIAAKLESPRKNENFIKINGTDIDKQQVIKLLKL